MAAEGVIDFYGNRSSIIAVNKKLEKIFKYHTWLGAFRQSLFTCIRFRIHYFPLIRQTVD